MTDGELLEHFLRQDDQTAFAALVQMHGGLVFGVCRRILGNHHDAEEAFQATFLVLARKASSLKGRASLAGWLHEAAQRTAQNAKRLRARRQIREQQVEPMPELTAVAAKDAQEIMPYVDEELSRLPEKYRLAIVLCDLEGNSQPEAARKVGCPLGTMSGWLTRGREMLRKRLIRRGLSVSSGMLVMALSQQAASASVPARLVASTVQMANVWVISSTVTTGAISPHVAALTEGVLKTMFYAQLKQVALAAAVIVFAGLGAGGVVYQMSAAEPATNQQYQDVLKNLRGNWKVIKVERQGNEVPAEKTQSAMMTYTFTETGFVARGQDNNNKEMAEGSLKIDVTKQPFEIDLFDMVLSRNGVRANEKSRIALMGVFELKEDTLKLRLVSHSEGRDLNGNALNRPVDLEITKADDALGDQLMTLRREKP